MATRWVSAVLVNWAPILTYTRKREEVLEWVEATLDPLAFSDGEETLGLAFGEPDMRLAISRRSMVLSSGASGTDMEQVLDEPLRGILDILTPAQTRVAQVIIRASEGLRATDYHDVARRFATRAHGGTRALARWTATDAAVLTDVETGGFTAQVDYGIVSPDEIRERILNPEISRVGAFLGAPSGRRLDQRMEQVPPVSLFVDALLDPMNDDYVSSSQDIWQIYSEAEERLLELADGLASSVTDQGEGDE